MLLLLPLALASELPLAERIPVINPPTHVPQGVMVADDLAINGTDRCILQTAGVVGDTRSIRWIAGAPASDTAVYLDGVLLLPTATVRRHW